MEVTVGDGMVNMFALKAVFVIYGLFLLVILLFAQSRSLVLAVRSSAGCFGRKVLPPKGDFLLSGEREGKITGIPE